MIDPTETDPARPVERETQATLALGLAGSPAVRIEPGRGQDWSTHVRIDEWEGPLGLLLSLIEGRRLDVLTVPLGSLAEA